MIDEFSDSESEDDSDVDEHMLAEQAVRNQIVGSEQLPSDASIWSLLAYCIVLSSLVLLSHTMVGPIPPQWCHCANAERGPVNVATIVLCLGFMEASSCSSPYDAKWRCGVLCGGIQSVVLVWTIIFMLKTGEVLSMLVAVFALVYFCVEHPRPQTSMWKLLIYYISVVCVLVAAVHCTLCASRCQRWLRRLSCLVVSAASSHPVHVSALVVLVWWATDYWNQGRVPAHAFLHVLGLRQHLAASDGVDRTLCPSQAPNFVPAGQGCPKGVSVGPGHHRTRHLSSNTHLSRHLSSYDAEY